MATKSKARTEQLIVELAGGIRPVAPLPSIPARLMRWAALAAAVVMFEAWLLGFRGDLAAVVTTPQFAWPFGLALVTAVIAGLLALRLSVPGSEGSRWARSLPILIGALWAGLLWQASVTAGRTPWEPLHTACALRVIALAALPSLGLLISVRNGFVLDRGWAASLAVLAGAALAAGAVQLACPIDRAAHLFVSHLLPAAVLVALGPAVANFLRDR